MKKSLANQIIKYWNKNCCGNTFAAKTKAVLYNNGHDWDVEIVPEGEFNHGQTFFNTEELVLVGKFFRVPFFVTHRDNVTKGVLF